MSFASIEMYNGAPTVMINGEPFMPMAMTTRIKKPEYMKQLRDSGIRIFFVYANTDWLRPGEMMRNKNGDEWYECRGWDIFKEEVDMLLKAVPDAYIIVRIGMHPPVKWMHEHPDDIVTYSDGKYKECTMCSEIHADDVPGCYSMCSENWRRDGAKALNDFCDMVDESCFADRVIGYFLAAGGTSEWYYMNRLIEKGENRYADISPSFRKEFGKLLKEKYGTVENLRKAWKNDTVTFENPTIPEIHERDYVHIDKEIVYAMNTFEGHGTTDHLNPKARTHLGVFLNANGYMNVFDFHNAWHQGTANSIVHFASVLKERYEGKLVGAFYGAYACTDYFDMSTTAGTLRILDSGKVDFLAAPCTYNNRFPGGLTTQREMQDSFKLRNMLFVSEDDSRTHLDPDFYRDAGHLFTPADTVTTLKRDFARDLLEGIFGWWFDQNPHGGRYQCEELFELFTRQQEIAKKYALVNRQKKNEIALIYDQESVHFVSTYTNGYMLDYYRTSDLARIGAPVDYYFHDDMAREDMPDYKMYLMINIFCLTDEERKVIDAKAAKNGATVVCLYAPGFINPDHIETPMAVENIEDITGFKVDLIDENVSPRFKVTNLSHPAVKFADPDRLYGYIDREVTGIMWADSPLQPPFMCPAFKIHEDEGVEVLGRYCIDNRPALVMKKLDKGYTSIYCASHILRSELLASIAEYAGCHIYNYNDDCLYADENFVMVHAKDTGKRTLHFKTECDPYEVYEKKSYGKGVKEIEFDMRLGETKMFYLNGEI